MFIFQWNFGLLVILSGLRFGQSINHPVILIPGDGGSQVNCRLNKSSVVHYVCSKTTNYFYNLWLNLELLAPIAIDCWVDNMKLVYNNETRTTSNSEGVEIEIPGFGNTSSVEWLDPTKASEGAYFNYIAEALVSEGYERDVSIRGAPYDFRKGPNENQDFITNLIKLVEETYLLNGNKTVMIIAHSMGGPTAHMMLQRVSQEWKDKYIKALVGLNGAWAGAVKALKVFAAGDNLGTFFLHAQVVKPMQISSPSLAWLMPSDSFWKEHEVLAKTPTKNYTVKDFQEYFIDIGWETGWEMYKDVLPYRKTLIPPGVEVHCLHGYGVDTTERVDFPQPKSFPLSPTLVKGNGDGTVNERSLEACGSWQGSQKQKVYHQTFLKVDHMGILRNINVLKYITQLIKSD